MLPLINSEAVDLLDSERLLYQLVMLERQASRGGKESIDHPKGGHDDVANAVAGALVMAFKNPGVKNFNRPIKYPQFEDFHRWGFTNVESKRSQDGPP